MLDSLCIFFLSPDLTPISQKCPVSWRLSNPHCNQVGPLESIIDYSPRAESLEIYPEVLTFIANIEANLDAGSLVCSAALESQIQFWKTSRRLLGGLAVRGHLGSSASKDKYNKHPLPLPPLTPTPNTMSIRPKGWHTLGNWFTSEPHSHLLDFI